MSTQHQKKHWCLTSYADNFPDMVHKLWNDETLSYAVFQEEKCPQTGRRHWQAFLSFAKKLRLTGVKKYFPNEHIEAMSGTPAECRAYCTKEATRLPGGRQVELGLLPQREKKETSVLLEECTELIKSGAPLSRIAEEYPTVFVRNNRGLTAYAKAIRPPAAATYRPLTVWTLFGDAGTGKTRAVMDWINKSNFSFYRKTYSKGSPSWWDGYTNQEVLVIDDFEGERSGCPVEEFLNLLDGYGHTRSWPIKGDHVYLDNVKFVFITSNSPPDSWFASSMNKRDAVLRRLPNIHEIKAPTTWSNIPMPTILAFTTRERSRSPRVPDRPASPPASPSVVPTQLSPPPLQRQSALCFSGSSLPSTPRRISSLCSSSSLDWLSLTRQETLPPTREFSFHCDDAFPLAGCPSSPLDE